MQSFSVTQLFIITSISHHCVSLKRDFMLQEFSLVSVIKCSTENTEPKYFCTTYQVNTTN